MDIAMFLRRRLTHGIVGRAIRFVTLAMWAIAFVKSGAELMREWRSRRRASNRGAGAGNPLPAP
jgi:hypothetical protein